MSQLVEVVLTEVGVAGLLVTIPDSGKEGIVRWIEVSWDRSLGRKSFSGEVGDRLLAIVVAEKPTMGRYVNLSLRRTDDPWQTITNKYRVNQVVRGEVVGVRHFGMFVQLEPGIDAVIWPREAPLLRDELLEDVLAVGDKVQGIITEIEPKKRQLRMSLNKYLAGLNYDEYLSNLAQLPQSQLFQTAKVFAVGSSYEVKSKEQSLPQSVYHGSPLKLGRILVVDDNKNESDKVCDILEEAFVGIQIMCVADGKAALSEIATNDYDLALVDVVLKEENGILVADKLRERQSSLLVVFISNDPTAILKETTERTHQFPFCLKVKAEILETIDSLLAGRLPVYIVAPEKEDDTFISQLGMPNVANQSLSQVLGTHLERLVQEIDASYAMILEANSINRSVAFMSVFPPLSEKLRLEAVDGLYYSPVRNVVEEEQLFYREYINQAHDKEFRYFFPLLVFRSCLGVPLKIPGFATRHVLFLLFEKMPTVPSSSQEKVVVVAQLIEMALQQEQWLDYMRRYQQRYLLGQLLGSFVHELSNKLDVLGSSVDMMMPIVDKVADVSDPVERAMWLTQMKETAVELGHVKSDLKELVWAYSRLARGRLEAVDLNELAGKIKLQLEMQARERGVFIALQLSPLPSAKAIYSRLEQVGLNVVLNAIQQIKLQCDRLRSIAAEKGDKVPLFRNGLVVIQTRYNEADATHPLQLMIIDTGPGINYYRQEQVFLMDTSMRKGGHGLGLFISRNLVETMGGRLRLADSVMFMGSAFVIDLPIWS